MPTGEYLQYGGQAVIEGVMMRSPHFFAVACRAPDQEIVMQSEAIASTWIGRQTWLKKPFLRGSLALLDAMALGIRALNFAAAVQMTEEDAAKNPVPPTSDEIVAAAVKPPSKTIQDSAVIGSMVLGLVFGVGLFFALPTFLTDLTVRFSHLTSNGQKNMLDGVIRIFIFIGYISLISLNSNIRRVFQYHGAEHKAINALEANQPLTLENAKAQTRLHPRCGTSFVIIVLLLSIVVFAFLPRPPILLRLPLHIIVLPLIAGAAYEAIRFAGKFRHNVLTKIVFAPGLLSQYLTTREPDDSQIEVAWAALVKVMDQEISYNQKVPVL